MAHRITIEPTHIALETGQRYRVHHEGRVLLPAYHLLDACRAQLALDITGRLQHGGGQGWRRSTEGGSGSLLKIERRQPA